MWDASPVKACRLRQGPSMPFSTPNPTWALHLPANSSSYCAAHTASRSTSFQRHIDPRSAGMRHATSARQRGQTDPALMRPHAESDHSDDAHVSSVGCAGELYLSAGIGLREGRVWASELSQQRFGRHDHDSTDRGIRRTWFCMPSAGEVYLSASIGLRNGRVWASEVLQQRARCSAVQA